MEKSGDAGTLPLRQCTDDNFAPTSRFFLKSSVPEFTRNFHGWRISSEKSRFSATGVSEKTRRLNSQRQPICPTTAFSQNGENLALIVNRLEQHDVEYSNFNALLKRFFSPFQTNVYQDLRQRHPTVPARDRLQYSNSRNSNFRRNHEVYRDGCHATFTGTAANNLRRWTRVGTAPGRGIAGCRAHS